MIRFALLAACAGGVAHAATPVAFVACPVYRDTDAGRKSGCWLAVDPASGIRYDVTAAPTKPDWNRTILVEGASAAEPGDPCGGAMLDPVRVSVLDEPCTRHLLPADGYKGRRFALPQRNVRPLYETRTLPAKPYVVGRFTVPFDFGGTFVAYQLADFYVDQAIEYARAVAPARITIAGSAQRERRMVSGRALSEPAGLGRTRATLIARAFVSRGVPAASIRIVGATAAPYVAAAFDGLAAPAARRVDILVEPVAPRIDRAGSR